ncbi:MAG: hypothetical protein MJZ81_02780 [Bacteroidales bacterium]|nr:hypothetical protein [Bacteroidales bacterium]
MNKISIEHLLDLIDSLPKNQGYDYIIPGKNKAVLLQVNKRSKTIDVEKMLEDGSRKSAGITLDSLSIIASAAIEGKPFSVDSIFNGSGSARSTWEALIANTTEFYWCKVNKKKHLVWLPEKPHDLGVISEIDSSDLPDVEIQYLEPSVCRYITQFDSELLNEDDLVRLLKKAVKLAPKDALTLAIHDFAIRYATHIDNCSQLAIKTWGNNSNSAVLSDGKKIGLYYRGFIDKSVDKSERLQVLNLPLQQIYYGAPGTGKSFGTDDKIKEIYPSKEEQKNNVFRTTFHPDSDYSTFVGTYKPTMVKAKQYQVILDYDSLVDKYKEYIEVKKNMTIASTLMGYDYHDSIVKMQPQHTIGELVADAYKNNTTYDSVLRGGMAVYESNPSTKSDKITYSFVPQTFTKAYIQAWRNYIIGEKKPVFLVIEEINRGNCAQIFGDLFQLLDRDDETGMSRYPIKPDTDLGCHIADELNDIAHKATEWKNVVEGEDLLLPPNLYIWATMNTSDQSLFPIDSAFKRRWDWKYVRINEGKDKETGQPLNFRIQFTTLEGEKVDESWWDFIQKINEKIEVATKSEDKKLGYFFCKPDKKANENDKENTIISAETFVGKVVFYLWQDVFKDYGFKSDIFKKEGNARLAFHDFYPHNIEPDEEKNPEGIDLKLVKRFIDKVMDRKPTEAPTEAPVTE